MKIIGFNLTKISVQRQEKPEEKIKVNQNIDIRDITKQKVPVSKQDSLKIQFKFEVSYGQKFAKLEFEGYLMLLPEKDESKKIIKSWKNKKIPNELRVPLFNFIMNKCNIKALTLEDEMSLPLHVPLPKIDPNKQQ